MTGNPIDPRFGGAFQSRFLFYFFAPFFALLSVALRASPAQAALTVFLATAAVWLFLVSRNQLNDITLAREHPERVFEGDDVPVRLTLSQRAGLPVSLVLVDDQFMASLQLHEHHIVPRMAPGWQVAIRYTQTAERHRGLYLVGPVRMLAADPLGVFMRHREAPLLTRVTVYPRPATLPGYTIPGPEAPAGPTLDSLSRTGQGDEIVTVRPYRRGDAPRRIHWRTSLRRSELHVIELNRTLQAELAVMLDLTRLSRLGLGAEATTELAIGAAVTLLTRAHEARHRFSLAYMRRDMTEFPAGSGLAHLHLLLDRLAIVEPEGDGNFWRAAAARALALGPGSRAVFVATLKQTPVVEVFELVKRLRQAHVMVDLVLIDPAEFIRIYREQEDSLAEREFLSMDRVSLLLSQAGARVWPLGRHVTRLSRVRAVEAPRTGFRTG